jgi:hypothetical protein
LLCLLVGLLSQKILDPQRTVFEQRPFGSAHGTHLVGVGLPAGFVPVSLSGGELARADPVGELPSLRIDRLLAMPQHGFERIRLARRHDGPAYYEAMSRGNCGAAAAHFDTAER